MKLNRQNIPFTMVANEVLSRTDISLKAKGLYAYLFSKPDGWDFAGDRIAKEMKDGRKVVFSALKELETSGLLKRSRHPDGKMEYTITYAGYHLPQKVKRLSEPTARNGQLPKRPMTKRGSISNKEEESNTEEESKKEVANEATPKEKSTWFFQTMIMKTLPDDAKQFLLNLCAKVGLDKALVWHEVQGFTAYWMELTPNGKKQRWELERTFEVDKRLTTWFVRHQKMAIKQGVPRGKGIVNATPA